MGKTNRKQVKLDKKALKALSNKNSKFFKEFREFTMRGSVVDLAVGVIIGAAFQNIVQSVVNDLLMPVIGMIFQADFSSLFIPLYSVENYADKIQEAGGASLSVVRDTLGLPVIAYGNFITQLINFIIMAFVIFLLVKGLNALSTVKLPLRAHDDQPDEEPAPPAPPTSEELLAEIRDLLKSQKTSADS